MFLTSQNSLLTIDLYKYIFFYQKALFDKIRQNKLGDLIDFNEDLVFFKTMPVSVVFGSNGDSMFDANVDFLSRDIFYFSKDKNIRIEKKGKNEEKKGKLK